MLINKIKCQGHKDTGEHFGVDNLGIIQERKSATKL